MALLAALAATAACGVQEPGSVSTQSAQPSAQPSAAATGPSCEDVWVVGERLPETYDGCLDGGVPVEDTTVYCSMGDVLIEHGEGFYATPGKPIALAEGGYAADPTYQRLHSTCTG